MRQLLAVINQDHFKFACNRSLVALSHTLWERDWEQIGFCKTSSEARVLSMSYHSRAEQAPCPADPRLAGSTAVYGKATLNL